MERGPLRVNQDSIKLAPYSPIGPTVMVTRIVSILKAEIRAACAKIRGFVVGNLLPIMLIRRREDGVEVTQNHPRTGRVPTREVIP